MKDVMQKEKRTWRRRRRNSGKTAIDGKVWFLDDPHKSGNINGRKLHFPN
jgi:hypothetical protein